MTQIPIEIVNAINSMLAPYGERFSPAGGQPTRNGYLNWSGAVKYTGLSKSTLQRAVNSGELKAPHKLTRARNGAVVFEIAELDKYIRAH